MIGLDSEQPKRGEGDFHDAVAVEFCDGDAGLFGLARITLAPNQGTAAVVGVLCAEGQLTAQVAESSIDLDPTSWEDVAAGPVRLGIDSPLERWSAALDCGDSGFDLKLTATTPALELVDPELSEAAGVEEYEQLCDVRGVITIDGKQRPVDCCGRRMHVWGAPAWDRLESRRAIFAASPKGPAVTILSARPSGGAHDDDRSSGYLVEGGSAHADPLGEILLSTVYGDGLMPRSAGAELYPPGAEFGHRLSGESLCEARVDNGERAHRISFFRWSLDGRPLWGSYQSVSPS